MTHTMWYLARSAGLVSWFLLATAVLWGLLLSTRVFDRRPSPKWLTDLHRFLGGLALVFTALHMAALVGDNYVYFGAKELLVPFASSWHPIAVAWGVISLWLLLAVEGTSLLMRHLSKRVWHAVHMSSFGLFVVATVHAFASGTDRRNMVFVAAVAATASVIVLLTVVRFTVPRRGARSAGGRTTPGPPVPVRVAELSAVRRPARV